MVFGIKIVPTNPMLTVYLVAYLKWKYNIVIPGRAKAMGSSFPGSHGFPVNLWPRSPSKPLTVVPVLVSLTRFSYLVVLIIQRLAVLVMIRLDFWVAKKPLGNSINPPPMGYWAFSDTIFTQLSLAESISGLERAHVKRKGAQYYHRKSKYWILTIRARSCGSS